MAERVLVTGGAGFIGSHVVERYLAAGYDVTVVDDLSSGRRENVPAEAEFVEADVGDPEVRSLLAQGRFAVLNHHAAQMDVRRSVAEPIFDADVNILGSLNLIECARRHRVKRVVYSSTGGAVYGEPMYLPCDEAHPINPIC